MTAVTASVIVATLNEAANIDHIVDIALRDDRVIELIIADGGSDDKTTEKIRARIVHDSRIRLINNPDRGQAAGLNRAAVAASGTLLVRLDGHSRYASDYVSASLAAWSEGQAVGGPMNAEGSNAWERATANAMDDPLAVGPARFHHAETVEEVDTVYLGTFDRSTFLTLGGYRTFPSGTVEDTDFYARWRSNGGTVLVDPTIESWYHPRNSWRKLVRQYFSYGRGKAELIWINGRLPSLRPLAPSLLGLGFLVTLIIGFTVTWVPFVALAILWTAALALITARSQTPRLRTAIVAGTMHISYGAGLWWGLLAGRPRVEALGLSDGTRTTI
jgi:succinoglycan biosynthesis protein ExoA